MGAGEEDDGASDGRKTLVVGLGEGEEKSDEESDMDFLVPAPPSFFLEKNVDRKSGTM